MDRRERHGHPPRRSTSPLASEFGDFGGNGTFSTALGASCNIKVDGHTISAECTNAGEATGSATFALTGDCGRGSTSKGIEFTAQRRQRSKAGSARCRDERDGERLRSSRAPSDAAPVSLEAHKTPRISLDSASPHEGRSSARSLRC